MGKKKDRYIYNIDRVNVEIDYDKLAESIAKANEKQSNKYAVSREWMKFIIHPIFWGITVVTGLLALGFFGHGAIELTMQVSAQVDTLNAIDWKSIIGSVFSCCIGFFLITICLFTAFTAKEVEKETDKYYVATMFSNVVALVAFIISLVALIKG